MTCVENYTDPYPRMISSFCWLEPFFSEFHLFADCFGFHLWKMPWHWWYYEDNDSMLLIWVKVLVCITMLKTCPLSTTRRRATLAMLTQWTTAHTPYTTPGSHSIMCKPYFNRILQFATLRDEILVHCNTPIETSRLQQNIADCHKKYADCNKSFADCNKIFEDWNSGSIYAYKT